MELRRLRPSRPLLPMNEQRKFDALDAISVLSLMLGYQNLQENRQQSAHNDVSAANEKQAKFLMEELGRKFEEQNEMLRQILEDLHNGKNHS